MQLQLVVLPGGVSMATPVFLPGQRLPNFFFCFPSFALIFLQHFETRLWHINLSQVA